MRCTDYLSHTSQEVEKGRWLYDSWIYCNFCIIQVSRWSSFPQEISRGEMEPVSHMHQLRKIKRSMILKSLLVSPSFLLIPANHPTPAPCPLFKFTVLGPHLKPNHILFWDIIECNFYLNLDMQHIRFNRCLLKTEPEHTSQFPDRNSDVFQFIKLSSVVFVKNIELLPIFTLLFSWCRYE